MMFDYKRSMTPNASETTEHRREIEAVDGQDIRLINEKLDDLYIAVKEMKDLLVEHNPKQKKRLKIRNIFSKLRFAHKKCQKQHNAPAKSVKQKSKRKKWIDIRKVFFGLMARMGFTYTGHQKRHNAHGKKRVVELFDESMENCRFYERDGYCIDLLYQIGVLKGLADALEAMGKFKDSDDYSHFTDYKTKIISAYGKMNYICRELSEDMTQGELREAVKKVQQARRLLITEAKFLQNT